MDLLRRYSNRSDLKSDLDAAVQQLRIEDQQGPAERRSVQSARKPEARACTAQRLGEEVITQLIEEYQAGAIGKDLAEKYGISLSSIRRLLKRRGGRLKDITSAHK